MKGSVGSHGYISIHLCDKANNRKFFGTLHGIMMKHFIGPPPLNYDVCHNDGNKLNNRLDNLRYDSRKNNMADKLIHGGSNRGEKQGLSKLKSAQVLEILRLREEGYEQKEIAKLFGVGRKTISHIEIGSTWSWLTGIERKNYKKGPTGARNQR